MEMLANGISEGVIDVSKYHAGNFVVEPVGQNKNVRDWSPNSQAMERERLSAIC